MAPVQYPASVAIAEGSQYAKIRICRLLLPLSCPRRPPPRLPQEGRRSRAAAPQGQAAPSGPRRDAGRSDPRVTCQLAPLRPHEPTPLPRLFEPGAPRPPYPAAAAPVHRRQRPSPRPPALRGAIAEAFVKAVYRRRSPRAAPRSASGRCSTWRGDDRADAAKLVTSYGMAQCMAADHASDVRALLGPIRGRRRGRHVQHHACASSWAVRRQRGRDRRGKGGRQDVARNPGRIPLSLVGGSARRTGFAMGCRQRARRKLGIQPEIARLPLVGPGVKRLTAPQAAALFRARQVSSLAMPKVKVAEVG